MNAQYFTEISLGQPPQTARVFIPILFPLTNPVLVQSHSRHWVRSTSSSSMSSFSLTFFALVQVIFGFQAQSVVPLPVSFTPSMIRTLPRHTKKTVPNSRSNMAPDPWKALSLTMC